MREHPALGLITEQTGMLSMNRPIVSLSVQVAEALRFCAETERELVILGRSTGRLTYPLRRMIRPGVRWAVKGTDGVYFDGLSGAPLVWDGSVLAPAADATEPHPRFGAVQEPEALHVLVTAVVRHRPVDRLVVGGTAERLCHELTGRAPAGWGTCEPAANPWSAEDVTRISRGRAPERTWLVFVGDPGAERSALGTIEVDRTVSGVQETVNLAVAWGTDRPLPDLGGLAEGAAHRFRLAYLAVQAIPGRADLTTEARFAGLPAPVGIALGPEAPRIDPPIRDVTVRSFGPRGAWYEMGDGRDVADWAKFQSVLERLEAGRAP
ncbi:DUF6177 family protein [Actinomadura rupiterrae]|uniref:DUF6177 family protein n=1 Tax=Actinomadura rupiterrae TaxID=559627 RepID=UPI0020A4969C|nr:DUF6177 family protein [Actinomadura rupiterrae]MCP2337576.1 hypothetical protein [Actinomadura rupiterrae]